MRAATWNVWYLDGWRELVWSQDAWPGTNVSSKEIEKYLSCFLVLFWGFLGQHDGQQWLLIKYYSHSLRYNCTGESTAHSWRGKTAKVYLHSSVVIQILWRHFRMQQVSQNALWTQLARTLQSTCTCCGSLFKWASWRTRCTWVTTRRSHPLLRDFKRCDGKDAMFIGRNRKCLTFRRIL